MSSAPPGRSSAVLLEAMVSRAFSMLSRSPLRSENQQSTSVLDSLVSWASWSAAEHSSLDQMSRFTFKMKAFFFLFLRKPRNSVPRGLKNGLIKNISAIPVMQAPTRDGPAAPLGREKMKSHGLDKYK